MDQIKWPNGAKCAVMLSFDVDGDTLQLNKNKHYNYGLRSQTIGKYGPLQGVSRILDLLNKYEIGATFFVPAWVAKNYSEQFKEIDRAGHEIAHHGYMHELFVNKSYYEQKEIIEKSQDIFQELIGRKACGFRTPSGDFSKETPRLLQEMGFKYSSSMRGDDRPYRMIIDNEETDLIEIPAKWELDDYPQFGYSFFPPSPKGQDRISSHHDTLDNFKIEFDGYYRFGLCYVLMMHPQVIGKPGRILMLEKLIQHIKTHDNVWFATGEKIANWWKQNY